MVALTGYSPEYFSPTSVPSRTCGQFGGAVPAGGTVSVHCDPQQSGRYVVIQFTTAERLNLCEVEICAQGEERSAVYLTY